MDINRSAQEQFGPVAHEYAAFDYHAAGPDLAPMLEAGRMSGRERVLDIGSGPGHTALLFATRAELVVASDPTEAMLEQGRRLARERGLENIEFEQTSAENLPFSDDSFDRVTSRQSAHHYLDIGSALRQVARVLAPEGRFVLIDSVSPEDDECDAFLNRIERLRDPSHVRDHRVSQWHGLFDEVGFDLEEEGQWNIPLDFDEWVARSRTSEAAIAELRTSFRDASARVRDRFYADSQGNWSVPTSLMVGIPRG